MRIPWLNLNVYKRADWAANFLVVIPIGWLGAAALDWGRTSRRLLLTAMPFIITLLCVVVVGIEFLQSWFPIRTQSLNDILAGCLGAAAGPIAWLLFGRPLTFAFLQIFESGFTWDKLWHASMAWIAINILYALVPLDLVFNLDELRQKLTMGRIEFLPGEYSLHTIAKPVILALVRVLPVTLMLCVARTPWTAFRIGLLFAALCEFIQIPIFSRTASLFDLLISFIGILLALSIHHFRSLLTPLLRRSSVWFFTTAMSGVCLLLIVVVKSDHFVEDPGELTKRWQGFWSWPLISYYYQPEFAALTTLLYKLSFFGWLGFCMGLSIYFHKQLYVKHFQSICYLTLTIIAVCFELLQIYFLPHIPDAFDMAWYALASITCCRLTIKAANSFTKNMVSLTSENT